MKLYHRTYQAKTISAEGFRDGRGAYGTDRIWQGWLSDSPLDINKGAAVLYAALATRIYTASTVLTIEQEPIDVVNLPAKMGERI